MVNELSIGERGEVDHSQVNPDIFIAHGQGFRLAHLTAKYGVPVLTLALDGHGFDRACHSAVQVYFDGADLRQFQIDADDPFFVCRTLFCLQFPARSIRVTERIVPIAPLKSWIAWVLSVLHAPKEVVKGVFEP